MDFYQEIALGFDAREAINNEPSDMVIRKKLGNMIKADAPYPISVDQEVWRPITDVIGIDKPDWTGPIQQHWENLDEMVKFLNHKRIDSSSYWIIGVSLVKSSCDLDFSTIWENRIRPVIPQDFAEISEFLGYDIADIWLESNLLNRPCGDHFNIRLLRDKWSSFINEYHLFSELEYANKFRNFSELEYPSHSPFCVYSLRRINLSATH